MPIIIYKFILLTTFKVQPTFAHLINNYTNIAMFNAVGLEERVIPISHFLHTQKQDWDKHL